MFDEEQLSLENFWTLGTAYQSYVGPEIRTQIYSTGIVMKCTLHQALFRRIS
jgi:hypothetical protein